MTTLVRNAAVNRIDLSGVLSGYVPYVGATANLDMGAFTVTASEFIGPLTGNADTATILQTARTINGVPFDGSADITITAAASGPAGGDLSGTYPNPTVSKINGVALGTTTATSGNLLIGSGSDWVTQAISGNVTISSTGVTTIGASQVTNAMLAGSIDLTKLQSVASGTLIGRWNSGAGTLDIINVGAGLTLGSSTLSVSATALTGILKGTGSSITTAVAGTDYEVPLTFSTGLTRSTNTITVNTSQNIAKLTNLTTNGFVKTTSGDGTLSIDTNTYITGNQTITLSGDVSGSGATAITTTLATVNSNVGTFGDSTHVAQVTVNAKGLVTAVSDVLITGAAPTGAAGGDLSGTYPNPTVAQVAVTNTTTNASFFPTFVSATTGSRAVDVNSNYTYNPSTGVTNITGVNPQITLQATSLAGNHEVAITLRRNLFAGQSYVRYQTGTTLLWRAGIYPNSNNYRIRDEANTVTVIELTPGTTPITTITGTINTASLTASMAVVTDSSKNLASLQYTDANTASTIVSRDASGDFSAGTITADLSGTATNATNIGITDDNTTNATMFPVWVTANTGNLPAKVSSTRFSFNPSTNTFVVNAAGSNFGASFTLNGGSAGSDPVLFVLNRQNNGYVAANTYLTASAASWVVGLRGGNENYRIHDFQNSIDVISIAPGATPITTIAGTVNLDGLTASRLVATDSSKNLSSVVYTDANTASAVVQRDGSGNFSAGTITASLNGNATTATSVTNIPITNDTTTNATMFPVWVTANTGNLPAKVTSTKLSFNPSTGTLSSTTFSGALSGNATTATSATNTAITDDTTTNATMYPTWVTTTTGNLPQKISSTKLTFNPSTATLTTTTFSGALSGNATTATTLQNARTIGGVSFNGSANIVPQTIQTVDSATNATHYMLFGASSGSVTSGQQPFTDADLTYNPSTNTLGVSNLNIAGSASYPCRAWVNFNGTGTVAIRSSQNVSSVSDGGTGTYTVNLTNAMPDANYAANITMQGNSNFASLFDGAPGSATVLTSSTIPIICTGSSGSRTDSSTVCVSIFR